MAVKKAAKKTAAKRARDVVEKFPTLSLAASINRLSEALALVSTARKDGGWRDPYEPDGAAYPSAPAPMRDSPPKSVPGVEQMACNVRAFAADIAKQSESIRIHLYQGNVPTPQDGANQLVAPTSGPIKDSLDATMAFLSSIRRDLDGIAGYLEA